MKAYNFLRLGADLVNARAADDARVRADAETAYQRQRDSESATLQRQQAESTMSANNALLELRKKQAADLDRKSRNDELFAGMNVSDPDFLAKVSKTGDPQLMQAATKLWGAHMKDSLLGVESTMNWVEEPKDMEERRTRHKTAVQNLVKINPGMSALLSFDYDPQVYSTMRGRAKDYLATMPNFSEIQWSQVNGQLVPVYKNSPTPAGPAIGTATNPNLPDANTRARITADQAKAEAERKAKAAERDAEIIAARKLVESIPEVRRAYWGRQSENAKQMALANQPLSTERAPATPAQKPPASKPDMTGAWEFTPKATQAQKTDLQQAMKRAGGDAKKQAAILKRAKENGIIK